MSVLEAKHSSKNDRWLTPRWVVYMANQFLGQIDLDPASEAEANLTVGAKRFIGFAEDGLVADWGDASTIFINPPGGKLDGKYKSDPVLKPCRSLPQAFLAKLIQYTWETRKGLATRAVYVGFSLEQLQSLQSNPKAKKFLECCTIVIPNKRIQFELPNDLRGSVGKRSPTHANFILFYESGDQFLDRSSLRDIVGGRGLILQHPEFAVV